MTALALNDLSISIELDRAALSGLAGGYLASAWQYQPVQTGNWGSWYFEKWVDAGFHSWNGKNYRVWNRHEIRYKTDTQRRWQSQWYD